MLVKSLLVELSLWKLDFIFLFFEVTNVPGTESSSFNKWESWLYELIWHKVKQDHLRYLSQTYPSM